MHQVSRSVVTTRRVTFFHINFSRDQIANFQTPFLNLNLVNDQALRGRESVIDNRQSSRWTNEYTDVSNLTTTLSIERRLIENNLALLAFVQRIDLIAFDYGDNLRIRNGRSLITLEDRSGQPPGKIRINRIRFGFRLTFFRCRRLLKLLKRRIKQTIKLVFLDHE